MKKILIILFSLMISFSFAFTVYAADISIGADSVNLSTSESTMIPVKTSGNSGIMGFKITVEYPVDKIEVKAVSRGEITTKGNFNTNFGINDGRFDVLWNNTENVSGDGTLFVITALAKTEIKKDTKINISFSQPDTFNESYKDVKLNCHNILISANKVKAAEAETKTTKSDDSSTTKAPAPIDSSQVTDAVQTALDKFGYKTLAEVTDEKAFIGQVNKNLETITGTTEHSVNDMDSLKSLYNSAYEGVFVSETTNNVDSDKINTAVEKALKTVGAKSIDDIDEKKKAEFVAEVEKNLKEENPETPNISKDIETDQATDIIKKIYNATNPTTPENKTETKNNKKVSSKIVFIIPIFVVLIIAGLIVIKNRKKNKQFVS